MLPEYLLRNLCLLLFKVCAPLPAPSLDAHPSPQDRKGVSHSAPHPHFLPQHNPQVTTQPTGLWVLLAPRFYWPPSLLIAGRASVDLFSSKNKNKNTPELQTPLHKHMQCFAQISVRSPWVKAPTHLTGLLLPVVGIDLAL